MTKLSDKAKWPISSLEYYVPETKNCKVHKGHRILKCISWKQKGSSDDGALCGLLSAVREMFACGGICNRDISSNFCFLKERFGCKFSSDGTAEKPLDSWYILFVDSAPVLKNMFLILL